MSLLVIAIGTAVIGTALWFMFGRSNSSEDNRKLFATRNVKHVPQQNAFLQFLLKSRIEFVRHADIARHGKTFGFWFLGRPTIVTAEPEIAQTVLSKDFTNFTNRRTFELNDPFFRNALSNVYDEQWKRLRAVITPTFSTGKLRRMKPLIDNTARTLIKNLDNAVAASPNVNVKQVYGAFTMDTVIQVAFGTKVDSLVEPNNPVITNAKKLFSVDMSLKNGIKFAMIFMTPKLTKMLNIRPNPEVVDYFTEFANQIIVRKRREMAAGNVGKAQSFIELLLESEVDNETEAIKRQEQQELNEKQNGQTNGMQNGHSNGMQNGHKNQMENGHTNEMQNGDLTSMPGKKIVKYITNDELISQCVLFFLAGYDTTATTITMASYLLATNPDKQEILYREISETLEKLSAEQGAEDSRDPVELVTLDSLSRFEYLNASVNETLRIYSPAVFTEREAGKDTTLESEDGRVRIDIRKGDIIQFPIYSMHRDERQFPEPEKFRPERFLNEPTFHKYAYLPFGSGPRNCVARSLALLEAKVALLHTLRKYKISVGEQTKIPPDFYYQSQLIVPRDIILKFEKR